MSEKTDDIGSRIGYMRHQRRLTSERGQGRYILGALILIVVGPVLAEATWKIQQGLSSAPLFTWWEALLIAVFIGALIVVAIFANE